MTDYDVIIIGAGPAGLSAAELLAKEKANVLCLDKKQEIGVPVRCAEGLGWGWFKRLNIEPDKAFVTTAIYGACIYAPSGKKIEFRFPEISGYVLERRIFEKFLARNAAKAGANIQVKSNVTKAERKNGKMELTFERFGEEQKVSADMIVSAEGVEAKIARQLGINAVNNLNDVDSGFQYEMAGIDFENPDLINLFFGNQVAPRGYCWIFPKGKHEANVGIGIGGLRPELAKTYLDKFVAGHEGLKNGSIIAVNAGAIPVGGFLDDMTADNLIVAGDSAHQVNPIHGGGIGLAIEGARLAAEVVAEAIKKNDFSHEFLKQYNPKWYAQRGEQLKGILKKRHMLEILKDKDYETLVDALDGDAVMKIAGGNLVQSAKVVGKKLIMHPGLAKIMLKYLK